MAAHYLLKTEPSEYSFENLKKDGETTWDGVHNPVALRNMAGMKAGDKLIIYETADRKSAIGTASVVSVDASNPKSPELTLKAGKDLARPVSLAEIKANREFADSPLVRQGRLSVVPLTAAQYAFLTKG
jgi:predicted RNA-binding protein with PUA-like domain